MISAGLSVTVVKEGFTATAERESNPSAMPRSKRKPKTLHPSLEEALSAAGNATRLAKSLGVSKAAVSQWHAIPIRHVERVSELYRIAKRRLLEPHLAQPR